VVHKLSHNFYACSVGFTLSKKIKR